MVHNGYDVSLGKLFDRNKLIIKFGHSFQNSDKKSDQIRQLDSIQRQTESIFNNV